MIAIKSIPDAENSCIQCHTSPDSWDPKDLKTMHEGGKFPLDALKNDLHWQKGMRCQDCHGGDPAIEEQGPSCQGRLPGDQVAGRHARLLRPLPLQHRVHAAFQSVAAHGPACRVLDQRARQEPEEGDLKVATCISCHDQPHGDAVDLNRTAFVP